MHIPDGFLDPKISTGLLGMAVGVLGYCLGQVMKTVTALVPHGVMAAAGNVVGAFQTGSRRIMTRFGADAVRRMGMAAAWVFAAQLFNFPIGSGTSGHLIGGVFAAVLVGPFAGALVIAAVLAVQAVFFADGGMLALGANIINMAVLGSLASYYLYAGLKKAVSERVAIAIAAWCSVMLAAFACSVEIGLSGTVSLPAVTTAMLKTHALIGVAEAGLTILLLKLFEGGTHP